MSSLCADLANVEDLERNLRHKIDLIQDEKIAQADVYRTQLAGTQDSVNRL